MKIVVGLGNPDEKYQNTFHNLGFMAVDKIAEKLGVSFNKTKCKAQIAELKVKGEKIIIAKPMTYMNLSGESVRELIGFYKVQLSDLLVIYDDYDLEKGAIRIRESGSAGTHNGMRNIVSLCGTDFARIRLGFKNSSENQIPLINYVLSGIKEEDKPVFENSIEKASLAGIDFINGLPIQMVMQTYNKRAVK